MTFEEILPGLKAKKKYVRTGWGGAENYVQLFDSIEQNGVALPVTPYFLINVSGEGEGFSMWSPTPCDKWCVTCNNKCLSFKTSQLIFCHHDSMTSSKLFSLHDKF